MNKEQKTSRGIVFMLLATVFFAITWVAIKAIGTGLPVFEVMFFRSFFSLLIFIPLTKFKTGSLQAKQNPLLILRSLISVLSMLLVYQAVRTIELGNVSALMNVMPVWVAVLSPLMLGETFYKHNFGLILLSLLGVCFVLKPDENILQNSALLPLAAGLFAAVSMVLVRKLTKNKSYTIALHFTVMAALITAPLCFANFIWPSLFQWSMLGIMGISVTVSQTLSTKAYKCADAAIIAPFGYANVVECYLLGMIFWQERYDTWSLIGAAIIIFAGIFIMQKSKKPHLVPSTSTAIKT